MKAKGDRAAELRLWQQRIKDAMGPSDEDFARAIGVLFPHLLAQDPRDKTIVRFKTRSPWIRPGMTDAEVFQMQLRREADGDIQPYLDDPPGRFGLSND